MIDVLEDQVARINRFSIILKYMYQEVVECAIGLRNYVNNYSSRASMFTF